MTALHRPIETLLEAFYRANDLPKDGGLSSNWFFLKMGPLKIPVPNTKGRKAILYLHDIHHLINAYDTSWKGEAAVSAWEVATGLGRHWTGWALSLSIFFVGVWLFPKVTFRAFLRGRRTQGLIALNQSREAVLAQSITQLRQATQIKPMDVHEPTAADYGAYLAWAALATVLYGSLWVLGIGGFLWLFL